MTESIYIIAEAAQGYEGSADVACILAKSAKKAGADAIKFQVIFADDLVSEEYQHYDLFKSLEMPEESWQKISDLCRSIGIELILDVFGPLSADVAKNVCADGVKIHSTCFFDDALHEFAFNNFDNIFVSIGGIEKFEVDQFVSKIPPGNSVVFMHGYQAEPTPIEKNHLNRISTLGKSTGSQVGFMDHSDGDGCDTELLSVLALGMGVKVFEKHITLARCLEMEDYTSALAPDGFKKYVDTLKRMALSLGSADLCLADEEFEYRSKVLKRVVARRDLESGELLSAENTRFVRSKNSQGLHQLSNAYGKKLRVSCERGQPVEENMVE